MTSRECFVYIALPGETTFVTTGKLQRAADRHDVPTSRFIYGRSYLERQNAVPIDPLALKLASTTYETRMLAHV